MLPSGRETTGTFGLRTFEQPAFRRIVIVMLLAIGGTFRVVQLWTVVGAIVIALATVPITGIQAWLDYPRILANMGPIADVHDSVSPTVWLLPVNGYDAARVVVLSIGTAAIIYVAKARPDIVSFPNAVTLSILVTPAVFHHYLSILVLPLLLAVAAGVRWWVVGLIYLLLWGGQQPALGDWAWVLSRVPQTIAYLLLTGALFGLRQIRTPSPATLLTPAST